MISRQWQVLRSSPNFDDVEHSLMEFNWLSVYFFGEAVPPVHEKVESCSVAHLSFVLQLLLRSES